MISTCIQFSLHLRQRDNMPSHPTTHKHAQQAGPQQSSDMSSHALLARLHVVQPHLSLYLFLDRGESHHTTSSTRLRVRCRYRSYSLFARPRRLPLPPPSHAVSRLLQLSLRDVYLASMLWRPVVMVVTQSPPGSTESKLPDLTHVGSCSNGLDAKLQGAMVSERCEAV
jgi:hypothetical protein